MYANPERAKEWARNKYSERRNEGICVKCGKRFNDLERLEFDSEKEACEYLGVKKCTVASCYRRGSKCKGYFVDRIGAKMNG